MGIEKGHFDWELSWLTGKYSHLVFKYLPVSKLQFGSVVNFNVEYLPVAGGSSTPAPVVRALVAGIVRYKTVLYGIKQKEVRWGRNPHARLDQ